MVDLRPADAYAHAVSSLSDDERELIAAMSEDASYVTPRVLSHLDEKQPTAR